MAEELTLSQSNVLQKMDDVENDWSAAELLALNSDARWPFYEASQVEEVFHELLAKGLIKPTRPDWFRITKAGLAACANDYFCQTCYGTGSFACPYTSSGAPSMDPNTGCCGACPEDVCRTCNGHGRVLADRPEEDQLRQKPKPSNPGQLLYQI